ncbi:hypothetical protein QCM80_46450, partial [Bradyrhizobium sp. SSUT112]|uniref:hypothetical protein n=1 Tax=Bradyrhizobium sp. SSUT112 TaxID=3040604 RepID=UPI00244A23CF
MTVDRANSTASLRGSCGLASRVAPNMDNRTAFTCRCLIEPWQLPQVCYRSRLCKNAAPHHLHATKAAVGVAIEFAARASRPHGCQQWLDA